MFWHDGWGWGAWLVMLVVNLVVWGLVFWAAATVVRIGSSERTGADPEKVLAVRFAAGEIGEDEYRSRLEALRGARSPSVDHGFQSPP